MAQKNFSRSSRYVFACPRSTFLLTQNFVRTQLLTIFLRTHTKSVCLQDKGFLRVSSSLITGKPYLVTQKPCVYHGTYPRYPKHITSLCSSVRWLGERTIL